MLVHVPGILDRTQLAAMREALQAAEWVDGRATVGAQGAQVKRNQQLPDASPTRREWAGVVLEAVSRSPLFHAATLPARIFPPRFNRYRDEGEYGFHVDGAVMGVDTVDGRSTQLRSDVSCTIFLNAPDEYDGGGLIISDTYGEHEVKLPAGDAIVYPSSSLHRVAPVTRGERLASFFWVQSLVRDDGRRRMLFELDASIQALGEAGAAREPVVRLTGVYHNLLRLWSEP